jgi:NAD(P)-dependent dehydrogenase (short-subunit alcohol dehydrogenase family)
MSKRFEGRRAFVTGAGSGMGRATVSRFAAEGARVLAVDRNADALAEAVSTWPPSVSILGLDVRDLAVSEALVSWRADVLVNAAGILRRHELLEHPRDEWQATLDVNLTAAFRLSRAFAARLVDAGEAGAIVNVCSIEAFTAAPGHAAYTASKGGILMLTRAFALELGAHRIRVNAVAPGVTETAMNQLLRDDPVRAKRLREPIPMGRFAQPVEQAEAIAFLASDEASYITGVVLPVDGGWLTA